MRDIKFRAFDTENKEMLEVQELDYEDSPNGQPTVRTTMYNDYFDIAEMILMQYTGLKDKNGTEIYEGDIVKVKNCQYHIGQVIYDTEYAEYEIEIDKNTAFPISVCYDDASELDIEVIGNIYDNPELLGE